MVMSAILFNGVEPFDQIFHILLREGLVKSGENCSRGSEKKTFKENLKPFYTCILPQILAVAIRLTSLIMHC